MAGLNNPDYENIAKQLTEKNLIVEHNNDLKSIKYVAFCNLVQEVAETEAELIAEKKLNKQLEKELAEMIRLSQKHEEKTRSEICKNLEDKIANLKQEQININNELCVKMQEIANKFEAIEVKCNPENIKLLVAKAKDSLAVLKTKILEEQQSNTNFNTELPALDGVFLQSQEDFIKQYGDLETNKKKLLDIINNYNELKAKFDSLDNN